MRLKSGHGGHGVARAGEFVAIGGLGCGVALLAVLTVSRRDYPGRGWRRRKGAARAGPDGESADEWLSPLRGAGARSSITRRNLPSWQEPAELAQPGPGHAGGWLPHAGQGGHWGYEEWGDRGERGGDDWVGDPDDWDRGADWDRADDEWARAYEWGQVELAADPGMPAWPVEDPRLLSGWAAEPAGDLQAEYLDGPLPGYMPAPPLAGEPDMGYPYVPGQPFVQPPELDGPWAGPPYATGPHLAQPPELDGPWAGPPHATGPHLVHPPGPDRPWAGHSYDTGPQFAHTPEPDGTWDEDDTSPLPVIIGTDPVEPEPRQGEPVSSPEPESAWEPAPARGPVSIWQPPSTQEPVSAWEPPPAQEPVSAWEPARAPGPGRGSFPGEGSPAENAYPPAPARPPAAPAQEKMEQIKELYLTAEAIGEDALTKHFEQLSQRQRALIREFFEEAGLGSGGATTRLGGDSAQDGAPLPG